MNTNLGHSPTNSSSRANQSSWRSPTMDWPDSSHTQSAGGFNGVFEYPLYIPPLLDGTMNSTLLSVNNASGVHPSMDVMVPGQTMMADLYIPHPGATQGKEGLSYADFTSDHTPAENQGLNRDTGSQSNEEDPK